MRRIAESACHRDSSREEEEGRCRCVPVHFFLSSPSHLSACTRTQRWQKTERERERERPHACVRARQRECARARERERKREREEREREGEREHVHQRAHLVHQRAHLIQDAPKNLNCVHDAHAEPDAARISAGGAACVCNATPTAHILRQMRVGIRGNADKILVYTRIRIARALPRPPAPVSLIPPPRLRSLFERA